MLACSAACLLKKGFLPSKTLKNRWRARPQLKLMLFQQGSKPSKRGWATSFVRVNRSYNLFCTSDVGGCLRTQVMHLCAHHCPVLKDTSCFRESFWLPENNCKEKMNMVFGLPLSNPPVLGLISWGVGAVGELSCHHPEHGCAQLLGPSGAAGIPSPEAGFPLDCGGSSLLHQTRLRNVRGVRDTRSGPGIFPTALGPDLGSAVPNTEAHEVSWVACRGYTGYREESQMPVNGTCRASDISYRALSNA